MSRKPTLSPSKISTYLACPVKYRWTYVDDRGKWYLRSKSYYSFGTTLHRVLERFHDSNDAGVTTTAEVLAAYEENWIEAGFSSSEEMAEAYGEGKAILERHVEEQIYAPRTAKTLFVERTLQSDFGDFLLVGRLDRVDEHEDGSLEIVDYKSGRARVTPEDVAADIAIGCYQLLLRDEYPERRVRGTICSLRSGEEACYEMPAEEMETLRKDLRLLGQEILTQEYYDLTPKTKPLCRSCDFVPLCRTHEDFEEVIGDQ